MPARIAAAPAAVGDVLAVSQQTICVGELADHLLRCVFFLVVISDQTFLANSWAARLPLHLTNQLESGHGADEPAACGDDQPDSANVGCRVWLPLWSRSLRVNGWFAVVGDRSGVGGAGGAGFECGLAQQGLE
jgi:hypothetical protein